MKEQNNVKEINHSKKKYIKPTLEVIELRPEERIAQASGSCAATHGVGQGCAPGGPPGGQT